MTTFPYSSPPSQTLLILWILTLITGLYLEVFRSMIDRIRAGISTPPAEDSGRVNYWAIF